MWNLLKFSKKLRKKDYEKELDELQAKITQVEASIKKNQMRQASFSSSWMLYSFLLYLLSSFLAFYFSPLEWGPLRFLPIVIGPVIIYIGKRFLKSFFQRKIKSLETFLDFLKTELKSKVEEIKMNEPYNKAKQLLERYETPKKEEPSSPSPVKGQPIRNRAQPNTPSTRPGMGGTPQPGFPGTPENPGVARNGNFPPGMMGPSTPQRGPPLPPFQQGQVFLNSPGFVSPQQPYQRGPPPPPTNATWIDKLVEYAVGDSQAANMNSMLEKVQNENMSLKNTVLELQRELMAMKQHSIGDPQARAIHSDEAGGSMESRRLSAEEHPQEHKQEEESGSEGERQNEEVSSAEVPNNENKEE